MGLQVWGFRGFPQFPGAAHGAPKKSTPTRPKRGGRTIKQSAIVVVARGSSKPRQEAIRSKSDTIFAIASGQGYGAHVYGERENARTHILCIYIYVCTYSLGHSHGHLGGGNGALSRKPPLLGLVPTRLEDCSTKGCGSDNHPRNTHRLSQ